MKHLLVVHVVFVFLTISAYANKELNMKEVKCLVCKATINEIEAANAKVDPKKKADVGGFRIGADGEATSNKIQYVKSEMYLTELFENVCDKMDDYARARLKSSKKLIVLKMITDEGTMNPLMSEVDFVQDEDLNKSLKHYCLEVLDENDEILLRTYMDDEKIENVPDKVCTEHAGYCRPFSGVVNSDIGLENELNDDEEEHDEL